uniref:Titin n=1 Tax=Cynoglossus semilaevis TaxID=244447 RepID=A0A3P8WGQ9_CYNSE
MNAKGVGAPAQTQELVEILERGAAPDLELDLELRKTLVVRAGCSIRVFVPIKGRPTPAVTWAKDDGPVPRAVIDSTESFTMLIIPESSRIDAGKYVLTLENASGKKSADIHVRVLDSPGPPLNLKPVKIDKDSITLQWEMPLIDGGARITNYVIEKRESTRKAFATVITKCNTTSVRIGDLGEGCEYYFRVSAENDYGIGEAVETPDPIRASQAPTPPESIIPTEITKNTVSLAWTKPKHDGGSRITGYVLEAQKKGTDQWAHVTTVKAMDFTVKNLNENEEYIFHVMAVNLSGRSAPRESKAIVLRDSNSLPEFDLRGICQKTIIAKAGEDIKVEIPVMGRPRPTVTWQKDGAMLKLTQRTNAESTAATTILSINECNRDDSGVYAMTGKNIVGSVTDNIIVKELPEGRWQKTNFTNIIETEYMATGLVEGNQYEFRVIARNAAGVFSIPSYSTGPINAKDEIEPPRVSIDPQYTQTIVVNAGDSFKIDADVHGKPLPSIHWVKDEQELGNSLNREIKNTPTRAHISVKEAKLSDGDKVEEPDLDIDPELRKIVTIKAGASLRLFIPIKGRPTPTIRWDKDEAAVKESAQVEVTSSYTSLVIDKMSRNDSGKYTVTAENSSGTKTALIVVRVLDTPSPPTNLMVKEITNQSVTLAWEPPLLDGGSKIKNYVVEKRESTRKTFAAVVTNCHKLSWKVEPLQEGCCYFFRIMAENAHGLGLPAVTDDALKASEVPQAPKSLIVTDQSKTSISLAWERPEYDGGSRVMQYLLEVQLKGQEKWSGVNTFKTMEATVANLNPGQEYLFRVTAINDKGKSDPRVLAGPVMTKDLVFEPDVRPAFSNYSVHVGKDLNVEIPIYGRPKPTVTWSKDGAPLKFTTRVNIVNTATHTKLSIKEAASDDGGMYSINVANAAGKKDATVEIIVLDKPGPPSGPVSNYIIQKRDTTTTTWENVSNNCARTSIKVPRLKTGAEYQFRIIAQNRYGKSHGLDSSCIVEWHEPVTDGGSSVLGYHLERKERNSILWVKINKTLIHETTFKINKVGSSVRSLCSEPVIAQDRTAEPSFDVDVEMRKVLTVKHGTAFTLKVPFKGQPVPMVDWAKEGVDLKVRGTIDVTSSSTSLTIEKSCRFDSGEYSVTIHSPLGKATLPMLVQVLDSPGPPVNVKVLAVTRDSATLAWEPPENDGGDTVKAYHVEKREASKKAWVSVTSNCHALTYKVEDLQEGAVYYFRVIGENEHGLGVPQEAKAGTKITGNI